MFLIVEDLAAERRRLQSLGIALGGDMTGDYSTLAQVRDPDGNLITLATASAALSGGVTRRPFGITEDPLAKARGVSFAVAGELDDSYRDGHARCLVVPDSELPADVVEGFRKGLHVVGVKGGAVADDPHAHVHLLRRWIACSVG